MNMPIVFKGCAMAVLIRAVTSGLAQAPVPPVVSPADTGLDRFPDSTAKPEIWQKQADFKSRWRQLQSDVSRLVDVAKGKDLAKLGEQLKRVADACTAVATSSDGIRPESDFATSGGWYFAGCRVLV